MEFKRINNILANLFGDKKVTEYTDNGVQMKCTFTMWLGRCYNVKFETK